MTRFRGAALSKLEPCHKLIDQHEMPRRGEGALLRGKTLEQVDGAQEPRARLVDIVLRGVRVADVCGARDERLPDQLLVDEAAEGPDVQSVGAIHERERLALLFRENRLQIRATLVEPRPGRGRIAAAEELGSQRNARGRDVEPAVEIA